MDTERLEDACRFVAIEGRLLDRRRLACLFGGADPSGALDALRGYRNVDGGFGNGLEPDKRVPDSQPLDVEAAFQVMDELGRVDHDLVLGACDFLDGLGAGVGCLTGAYRRHPHAPHWGDWALAPSLNPTAGIVALLWKWDVEHPWRDAATSFCWREIEVGLPSQAHSFGEVLSFLASVPDRERAEAAGREAAAQLKSLELFRLDPDAEGYGLTPLHFAPSPASPWVGLFEASVIEAHLDALESDQRDDGGWPISWTTIGAAAECEWRGAETLRALLVLGAYGRIC